MKLSVIIVNFNVKYFLEQALQSLLRSETPFEFEVIVVDNASADGSADMVRERFPEVEFIWNEENLGFSKANNIGIRESEGEYVLLLNPDTIVKEDSLEKMVAFMDGHAEAGGLGVKMMDGKGHFLPESKRGFPSPYVAFCKMSGLSRLFPRSRRFNYYHLGHLDRDAVHEVDVLSGACMLLRRSALDKTGLLDEDYFMYGEDIDLSYRIKDVGYINYYFPETEIIHFKGESTRKGSFNYVRMFYRAMIIFTRKHLKGPSARYLTFLLQIAIYFRAAAAVVRRLAVQLSWPVLDALTLLGILFGIKRLWEEVIREGIVFPDTYLTVNVPMYIGIWLLTFFFIGGYDRPFRLRKIPYAIGIGTVIILAVYALLPESLRTSRGMILTGAVMAVASMSLLRILRYAVAGQLDELFGKHKRILLVAGPEDSRRIRDLIERSGLEHQVAGVIHDEANDPDGNRLGRVEDIPDISRLYEIDEIIFSQKTVRNADIMEVISAIGGIVDYKILSEGSEVILGSHSKHAPGELYTVDINFHLNQARHRRVKRIFDWLAALLLFIGAPLFLLFVRRKKGYFGNIFGVLGGRLTWIGYAGDERSGLPRLPEAVIPVVDGNLDSDLIRRANLAYARDYRWWMDLRRLTRL